MLEGGDCLILRPRMWAFIRGGGRLFEDRGNMVLSLKYIVIVSEAIDPAILRKRLKPSVPQKSPN